jgi:hypothetical protein
MPRKTNKNITKYPYADSKLRASIFCQANLKVKNHVILFYF